MAALGALVLAWGVALALPERGSGAATVVPSSGSVLYISSSEASQRASYVAYSVTAVTAEDDVWVTIGDFSGGVVSLAPNGASTVHVGPVAAGETKTVFFYLQASGATILPQGHTVRAYDGKPGAGGSEIGSAAHTLTVSSTLNANPNRVLSVSMSAGSPTLGSSFTITVSGETGTIGGTQTLYFTPAAEVGFAANVFQLVSTQVTFSESGCPSATKNCGTFTNALLIPAAQMPSSGNTPYTAVYTFRAISTSAVSTAVKPLGYISSGAQIKYTGSYPQSLPPIDPVANTLTLSASASPTLVNATERDATITLTAANSGAATRMDDFVATLPAGASYLAGSSRYGGAAVADPAVSGQTLTWAQLLDVPAGGSGVLTFDVRYPAVEGSHTISAVGHVASAQIDTTLATTDDAPATASVSVDATAPVATITSGPADPSASGLASFAFTADGAGATFRCSLDGGAPVACASPKTYAGLADGAHTFAVRAVDAAGNLGPTDEHTWTVAVPEDTVAPTVTLGSAPAAETTETTAAFSFSADEDALFLCRLDGGAWAECSSPASYTGLAPGEHVFEVKAQDGAGNESNPVSHTWTVAEPDTTPPAVTIDSGPSGATTSTSAVFSFSADEAASFQCSIDGGAWQPCMSPAGYADLEPGEHTFAVRATDGSDNTSAPASRSWTVESEPEPEPEPTVSIDSGPPATTEETSAELTFSGSAPTAFECSLDGATWEACTSPAAIADLSPGGHEFRVRAAGGSGDPATHSWTVTEPSSETELSIAAAPSGESEPLAVTETPAAPEPAGGPAGAPRLALTASADRALVPAGGRASVTVTVSNVGSADATHVVVTVELPVRADAALVPGECRLEGATALCALGSLGPGASRVVEISFRARRAGPIVTRAAVAAEPQGAIDVAQRVTGCTILGTEGDDVLVGTPGRDVICGLGGQDVLSGLGGDDVLLGGDGSDLLYGGEGADLLDGGAGHDLLDGGAGDDVLRGRDGTDHLFGRGGADRLYGDEGDDVLAGGGGDDLLYGGAGRDRLEGGPGRNWLNGGRGRDLAVAPGRELGLHLIERRRSS